MHQVLELTRPIEMVTIGDEDNAEEPEVITLDDNADAEFQEPEVITLDD